VTQPIGLRCKFYAIILFAQTSTKYFISLERLISSFRKIKYLKIAKVSKTVGGVGEKGNNELALNRVLEKVKVCKEC